MEEPGKSRGVIIFLRKNHNNHKYELIFQDAHLNLNLTDFSGTLIWKAGIKEIIRSQKNYK